MTLRVGEKMWRPCSRCGVYYSPTGVAGRICEKCSFKNRYPQRKKKKKVLKKNVLKKNVLKKKVLKKKVNHK